VEKCRFYREIYLLEIARYGEFFASNFAEGNDEE
jgi:hypothetical protein